MQENEKVGLRNLNNNY